MSTRSAPPTFEQACGLPSLLDTAVSNLHEDANGHLNVTGHLALFDTAGWPWLASVGLDPSSSGRPRGLMDVEHHLRYLAEVHVGDRVTVHAQLLERNHRRLHGIWFLVDHTRQQVASTLEFVSIHVDLAHRRSLAFDEETAAALDAQIAEAVRDWDPPLSGVMDF